VRLAFLGADDVTVAIVAAANRTGHSVVLASEIGLRASALKEILPELPLADDWEMLLDTSVLDAVIVAADQPALRIDQLRRLTQLSIPTLISHPLSLSMLDCYELDMIRRETVAIMLPYLPARWHPLAAQVRSAVLALGDSQIGAIEQVQFERFLVDRDRETVLRQFARDADLMQFVAGDATKLHALGSATADSAYSTLNVQMTCLHGLVCRWSVAQAAGETGGRLTAVGARGKVVLRLSEHLDEWEAQWQTPTESAPRTGSLWDPAAIALEHLDAAIASGVTPEPTWSQASRTVELAETISTSLARGRTIDLHVEEFTDIGTFKGTMASLGCGLLMAGVFLAVVALMVRTLAVQAGWQRLVDILDFWPYVLLGMLAIYLVLQIFVLIGKPKPKDTLKRPE
jgi:predicted dehydrogenase